MKVIEGDTVRIIVSRAELGHHCIVTDPAIDGKFLLGPIWLTPGICDKGVNWRPLLQRHASGDFGLFGQLDQITITPAELQGGCFVTDDDGKLNKIAIIRGHGRIMSIYDDIWIVTEFNGSDAETTVLFDWEY